MQVFKKKIAMILAKYHGKKLQIKFLILVLQHFLKKHPLVPPWACAYLKNTPHFGHYVIMNWLRIINH
jgi:hypothetical protein